MIGLHGISGGGQAAANGHGEGISGIMLGKNGCRGEKMSDHGLNLHFIRMAHPHNAFFDGVGRVFPNRNAKGRRCHQNNPPRMAQRQAAFGIPIDKHHLHSRAMGLMAFQQSTECLVQKRQSFGQTKGLGGRNMARIHIAQTVSIRFNHPPSRSTQSGIKADDALGWGHGDAFGCFFYKP